MYDVFSFADDEEREKYDFILQKFEEFYIPKTNITCGMFLHENAETSGSLRHCSTCLAQTCGFRAIRDSLIRGRIGVADHRLTERFLDPDLTKALDLSSGGRSEHF